MFTSGPPRAVQTLLSGSPAAEGAEPSWMDLTLSHGPARRVSDHVSLT